MDIFEVPLIKKNQYAISNFLNGETKEEIISEIFNGLKEKQKNISCRFFYNDTGSILFEEITDLPEYYPTRIEKEILKAVAHKITENSELFDIIELGSGDCSKISILLDTYPKNALNSIHYFPMDVSETAILKSADYLSVNYSNKTT